jgi:hypothetical protein
MAQKLMSMTRLAGALSGFEGYLSRLQALDTAGAPSRDEARRDYKDMLRRRR